MARNLYPLKKFAWWLMVSKAPTTWSVFRRSAGPNPFRHTVKRACEALGLDAENQDDRELLLGILCEAHFPATNALARLDIPKRRGPRVKWDETKKKQFKIDILDTLDSLPDNSQHLKHEEICELVKARYKNRYLATPETLAKYLRQILRRGNK